MNKLLEAGWFKLLAAVVMTAVLFALVWTVMGKTIGTPCHGRLDCFGLSAKCLNVRTRDEYVCTRSCEAAADCPAGWTCEGEPLLNPRTQEVTLEQVCSPPAVVPVVP